MQVGHKNIQGRTAEMEIKKNPKKFKKKQKRKDTEGNKSERTHGAQGAESDLSFIQLANEAKKPDI